MQDASIAAALRAARFGVVVYSADRKILEWNAGAERIFGVASADALGKTLDEVTSHPHVACEWHVEPVDEGATMAIVIDVSAAKARERASKVRERLLQAILDNLSVVVWEVDKKGIFTFHDGKKGLEAIGMQPGALVGMDIFELYRESGADKTVTSALAGTPTYNAAEADGRTWETWTLPLYAENGEVDAAAGITLDVTDIRSSERNLRAKLELIERQQKMIRELSMPLIETWDGVLTLPMVGTIDTERVAEVMENLLTEITRRKARFAIVDLTGVEAVDTRVASHILSLVRAIQLLGAEGIVTGIRPSTAQTMVMLGADLSGILTHANLKEALRYCIQRIARAQA